MKNQSKIVQSSYFEYVEVDDTSVQSDLLKTRLQRGNTTKHVFKVELVKWVNRADKTDLIKVFGSWVR